MKKNILAASAGLLIRYDGGIFNARWKAGGSQFDLPPGTKKTEIIRKKRKRKKTRSDQKILFGKSLWIRAVPEEEDSLQWEGYLPRDAVRARYAHDSRVIIISVPRVLQKFQWGHPQRGRQIQVGS